MGSLTVCLFSLGFGDKIDLCVLTRDEFGFVLCLQEHHSLQILDAPNIDTTNMHTDNKANESKEI